MVGIQILVETFRIQILARDVSGDESESFRETVWLVSWILIQKNSELFVGKDNLNTTYFNLFRLKTK